MIPVLLATAAWHGLAAWHFGLKPERTLARTTAERPISPAAIELLRFLAGLNLALVVLALGACVTPGPAQRLAAVVLAVANASQAAIDVRVQRRGLARGPMFRQILI